MSIQWYAILILTVFGAGTVGIFSAWNAIRRWRGLRLPVKEKMLRPPGNSLRAQLDEREEALVSYLMFAVVAPTLVAAMIALGGVLRQPIPMDKAIGGAVCGLVAWLPACYLLSRTVRKRRDYYLGYRGELVVAEHLQELARMGCHVFHDLQPDQTWNIDHIVVAPDSVLVIETKTRRKREIANGKNAHEVIFDGRQLHFPQWTDTYGLAQAERNAGWVRDYLAKALAEPVKVEAVLALPGWMVRRQGRGKVCVLNPKEVRALVRVRGGPAISPEKDKRMRQIAHALEQRCRDVEF